MASKVSQKNVDGSSAAFALIMLLGGVVAVGLFLIGPNMRRYLEVYIWHINREAFCATVCIVLLLVVIIVLGSKKRSVFITKELTEGVKILKNDNITLLTKAKFYLPHAFLCTLAFGLYAYFYYLNKDIQWKFVDVLKTQDYHWLRISLFLINGILPFVLMPFFIEFLLSALKISSSWREYVLKQTNSDIYIKGSLPPPKDYLCKDKPIFLLGAREFSSSKKFEKDAKIPSWIYYQPPLVFGGLIIFGKKGSGKSALIMRSIEDAIAFSHDDPIKKCALTVIDAKGDLTKHVLKMAKLYGREDDVTVLGVGTFAKWNPLAHLGKLSRTEDCRQAGYYLRCAMSSGSSKSGGDNFWNDNADNMLFRTIHILALAGKSVNFDSIYKFITCLSDGDVHIRNELYAEAEIFANNLGFDSPQAHELEDTRIYFEKEFTKLDNKIRTTVVNVASNFLQKFLTIEYKRSFGCSQDDPGQFQGFKDLIANGKIFVLDIRSNEHGTISNALCMMSKLYYQGAVKTRDRYEPEDRPKRATVTIWDEFQGYCTPSSDNTEGDDKYLETSRSFLAIDIAATQQFASIAAAVGKDMASRIIGSFNNIICYKHNDPSLTQYLKDLVGREEKLESSVSVTESSSSAEKDHFSSEGNLEQDHSVSRSVSHQNREKEILDARVFAGLSQFEAIGLFDEADGLKVRRFCVKPHFVSPTTPHKDVIKLVVPDYDLN